MGWYVVQVRSGHEKEIAKKCRNLIAQDILCECFIPEYISKKKYQGEWHEIKQTLFQGYIFMVTDKIELLFVELNKVPEFTKVIGKKKTEIFSLEEDEVSFLQTFGKIEHSVEMSQGVIVGDQVHITDGPLKGKECLITKIDRHKRLAYIQINMCNKEVITKVGLEIISKC